MDKDKHVLPDTTDTLAEKVRRDEEKKKKGVIFGADNTVIREVDIPDEDTVKLPDRKEL